MDLEHERRLAETESRSKSNTKRIEELERTTDTIQQLATSVAVMAEQMRTMNGSLASLSNKVETLEAEPAKKWRFVVEKSICFVVGAIIAYVLSQVGL